jgi:ankyrin repeat protein
MEKLQSCFAWLPCFMKVPVLVEEAKQPLTLVEKRLARDLYDSCWDGDLIGCLDLLDKGASPDVPFGLKNSTALHAAVKTANIQMVNAILRHKPNLTSRDTDGNTAHDIAERSGAQVIVEAIKNSKLTR